MPTERLNLKNLFLLNGTFWRTTSPFRLCDAPKVRTYGSRIDRIKLACFTSCVWPSLTAFKAFSSCVGSIGLFVISDLFFFFLDDKLSKSNIRRKGLYKCRCIFRNAFSIWLTHETNIEKFQNFFAK